MSSELPLYAGATLGVLGGGQLGRMFAVEALRMGYRVQVFDPDPGSPAGAIATRHVEAGFDNEQALREFGEACDAITIEFENVPASAVRILSTMARVTPSAECIEIAQDRVIEKEFAQKAGLKATPFAVIESAADLELACQQVGFPSILKTARLGYDGKGQAVCRSSAEVTDAFDDVGQVTCVLEKMVDLEREVSVVLSRDDSGAVHFFPVAENRHTNGILDVTLVPAQASDDQQAQAQKLAAALADALNYIGILAVEMFIDSDGQILINEMAPRPHNSGHFTLDACSVSQFEEQVRMLCGLPSGDLALQSPVAMLNLLGDSWFPAEPDWQTLYASTGTALHLYGKHEARKGRKMGHINVLATDVASALQTVSHLKQVLQS